MSRSILDRLLRLGALLRRRGWVLVTSAAVVSMVSMATASRAPVRYSAQAMVIVPSGASSAGPGDAAEANRLAATYSEMIPASSEIDDHVARQLDMPVGTIADALSVTNVTDTSLLDVRFHAGSAEAAVRGIGAVLDAIAGPAPATGAIPKGSLVVVRAPREATSTSKPFGAALPIGILLGLFLGAILVVSWERADARVDDAVTLGEEAGCPASNLDLLSPASMAALLDRWEALAGESGPRVALIGVRRGQIAVTTSVTEQLVLAGRVEGRQVATEGERFTGDRQTIPGDLRRDGRRRNEGGEMTLVPAGAPGGDEAGESLALSSALTILVAPMSVRLSEVRAAAATLRQFGAAPSWALMTRQRRFRSDVRPPEQRTWRAITGIRS